MIKVKEGFIKLAKSKSKELGQTITSIALENINSITSTMQASLGNELIIATVIPMIPSLALDEVKKRIFDTEMQDLGQKLYHNRDQLNHNFIESVEGRKLFQDILQEIINKSEQEKIQYQKQFLVSSFILETPDQLKLKKYREILLQMTSLDVKLLHLFCEPEDFIRQLRITKYKLHEEQGGDTQLLLPMNLNDYHFKVDEGL
jgi:hypothetical protein